jgi:hypothetical protein
MELITIGASDVVSTGECEMVKRGGARPQTLFFLFVVRRRALCQPLPPHILNMLHKLQLSILVALALLAAGALGSNFHNQWIFKQMYMAL